MQHRRVYLAYAVGTALAALVCLAMTALTIAVAASNGTVVDQSGVTAEDRVLVGVFAVLTLILTPTAVYRFRRLRRISDEAPTSRDCEQHGGHLTSRVGRQLTRVGGG